MLTLRSVLSFLAIGAAVAGCSSADEAMSAEDCSAMGGKLIVDPGNGSTSRDGCAAGQELLGSVKFGVEGAICCK